MIQREAGRGERESPRAMTPEVVAAKDHAPRRRVAAARGVDGCGLLKPSAAPPGGAAQLLAASLPSRSHIRFASKSGRKFTALSRSASSGPLSPNGIYGISRRDARSFCFEAGGLCHLTPLLGFVHDEFAKVGGRGWKGCCTQVG